MRLLARILALGPRRAVAADVVGLVAFVTVGLVNHHGGVSAAGYARDAIPIVCCWLLAGGAFGLYQRPRARALVETWLVGITAGILLRALVRRHLDGGDAVFLAVALCFSLLFVVAARLAGGYVRA
jgi:hypothetical protein